jgi:LuxR family maltose regulon positive regulatory protein
LALVDVLAGRAADVALGVVTPEAHVARALRALLEARTDEVEGHLRRVPVGNQPLGAVVAVIRARLARDPHPLDEFALLHPQAAATPYARAALGLWRARLAGEAPDVETLEPVDVESAARLALAHATAREAAAAARALDTALKLAAETGVRWPFVELGAPMEALLRQRLHSPTTQRALIIDLIGRGLGAHETAPLRDPLSPREETLLRYLPTQLANREIAAELFITTNTVKTHLRSIYRKLEVEGRRVAVARARDLHLLGR